MGSGLCYIVSCPHAAACVKHSADTRGARPVQDDFLTPGNWGVGEAKGLEGLGVVAVELLAFLFVLYSVRI